MDDLPALPDLREKGAHEWLPLDTVRDCFGLLVAGPAPLSIDGRGFPALPDRDVPLDELRDRLLRRRCPRRTRDAVWAHLVHRSRTSGPAWTVACAGMALPALAGVARWLAARFPGEPADVHAEVLSGFLASLPTLDLEAPHVLARLRWAAYRAGHTALTDALDAPTPLPPGLASTPPRPPWGHPDLVLARAVGCGVLTPTEADLIGSTRLEEHRLADWARDRGAAPAAVYQVRLRAERRLLAYLTDAACDADPDDPVAAHVLARTTPPTLPGPSRPVTGLRVGHPRRRGKKSSAAVSKTSPEPGLVHCGDLTPAPTTPVSRMEVRACA